MLKRIKVQGFKSLVDVEVELSPLVVVLGANAAGKSNLLEALMLLSRLATEKTLADAFDPLRGYPAEAFSLPEAGLPGLLEAERAELSIEADLRTTEGHDLRYRVGVDIQPGTGTLEVVDEYLTRLTSSASPRSMPPRIEKVGDHLEVRQLGRAGHPRHEPLRLNHTLVSNRQFSGNSRYPDFEQLRDELQSWRSYFLDPRHAMREPQPPREVDDIGTRGEYIAPYLHRLRESEELSHRFRAVRRALHSAIPSVESLNVSLDKNRGTLDIEIRQDGTPFSSRVISEGTLRVLALCAIAANPVPGSLIAFEEPENGVHPRRIEVIAEILARLGRTGSNQVVVTTHSPTLVRVLAQKQASDPDQITLLRCFQEGKTTRLVPFDASPLWQEEAIREGLSDPDDSLPIEEMMIRGWLDG